MAGTQEDERGQPSAGSSMRIPILQDLGREAAWALLSPPPCSCNQLLGCNVAFPAVKPKPRAAAERRTPPLSLQGANLCLDGGISTGKGILQSICSATQTWTKSPRKAHVGRTGDTMGKASETSRSIRHRVTGATATQHGYTQVCAHQESITKEIIKVTMSNTQNFKKCEN